MPRFKIIETVELEVEADTAEEAEQRYLEAASDDAFNPRVTERTVEEMDA